MSRDLKYQRLYEELKKQIIKGESQIGSMLPSESQLMARYNLSRITVRNALALLEQEGYLYRIQGKGCFVSGNVRQQSLDKIHSYTDMIMEAGMEPSRIILSAAVTPATREDSATLHLKENDPVFVLERIFLADGQPICLTKAILPYTRISGIEQFDFSEFSLYEVLESQYGLTVDRVAMTFEASASDQTVSELLFVKPNTPLLIYNSVSYTKNGRVDIPIEICKSYYLTNVIKYRLDKRR